MVKKRRFLSRMRTVFTRSERRKAQKAQKILTDWEAVYKDLQSHPLTQSKVINERLLSTTNETIKRFDKKLVDFDNRIVKLEQRRIKVIRNAQEVPLEVLDNKSTKTAKRRKPSSKEIRTNIIKRVVADPHMSDHEKEIVKHIQKDEADAQTIAAQFNISRSNASLKMNKLHDWGFLSKRLVDKTVFYRIKDEE